MEKKRRSILNEVNNDYWVKENMLQKMALSEEAPSASVCVCVWARARTRFKKKSATNSEFNLQEAFGE